MPLSIRGEAGGSIKDTAMNYIKRFYGGKSVFTVVPVQPVLMCVSLQGNVRFGDYGITNAESIGLTAQQVLSCIFSGESEIPF